MKYLTEIDALNGIAKSFERIADTLDVIALGQDSLVQTVDELVNVVEEIAGDIEPPVVKKGTFPLPGFPTGDPLTGFPTIRKDTDGK